MNRCKTIRFAPFLIAAAASLAGATGLFGLQSAAHAQIPQTQNEAIAGGRNFPINTLRGRFMVVAAPEVQLDGRPDRLSPGARIHNPNRMLAMTGAITGQEFIVNYTRDAAGLLREVWILNAQEASTDRASLERPFLDIWPFNITSNKPDPRLIPFDQLPKYGQ